VKILFMAPQPFYTERGTPIAVRIAVETLARAGHDIDLLVYHEGHDIAMPGVRLVRITPPPGIHNIPIGFSVKKLICDAFMFAASLRMIVRNRYDVVHAVEEAVFIAFALRLFRRLRVVYDADSILSDQIVEKWPRAHPLANVARLIERFAFRRSDLVLAVCPAIVTRAQASAEARRVHLLPDVAFPAEPPVSPVEDLRALVRPGRSLALYVGNLEHYQGFDLLLDAIANMDARTRCQLVVIGGSDGAVSQYRAAAAANGIGEDVLFLGPRPLGNLQHYLIQADILCSPRLKGVNTPMKIYSYMASGRAILATDIDSHLQVLDADTAMLVSPVARAMAAGLQTLCAHPSLRTLLGTAAAARAASDYSPEAFERRINRAYRVLEVTA
jgi:glycosyltransferase involved in cell wall biosynthesis